MKTKKIHIMLIILLLFSFPKSTPCFIGKKLSALNTKKEHIFYLEDYKIRIRQKKIGPNHIQIFSQNGRVKINKKTIQTQQKDIKRLETIVYGKVLKLTYINNKKELFDISTGNPVCVKKTGAYFIVKHPKKTELIHKNSGKRITVKTNDQHECSIRKNVLIVEQKREPIHTIGLCQHTKIKKLSPIISLFSVHTGKKIASLCRHTKKSKNT